MGGAVEIFRFVELSNQTKSPKLIFDLLVEAASNEGFDQVAYGAANYRASVGHADYLPQAIMLNYLRWPAPSCGRASPNAA